MAENKHDLDRPPAGHETTDVNAWVIGKFGIALVLICVASVGLLLGLFHYFIVREGPAPPKAYSSLDQAKVQRPGGTVLEETPVQDLKRERAAEEQFLNSYGWEDKQKGTVRIPIDKAIDLLTQKGLPSRAVQPQASDVSQPSESGLGQIGGDK
jgi:hypothetical protein